MCVLCVAELKVSDVLEAIPSQKSLFEQILMSSSALALPQRVSQQLKLRVPLDVVSKQDSSAASSLVSVLEPLMCCVVPESKYPAASAHGGNAECMAQVAVLRGLAGSGKTLSSWAIWNTCMSEQKRYRIPVHISLPEFRKAIKLEQDLMEAFFQRHAPEVLELSQSELQQTAELFIILDGLDEVADTPVNLWRDNGLAQWDKCRFLLTARREFLPDQQLSTYVTPEGTALCSICNTLQRASVLY